RNQLAFELASFKSLRLDTINCQLRSIRQSHHSMKLVLNRRAHKKPFRKQHHRLSAWNSLYAHRNSADCREHTKTLSSIQTRTKRKIQRSHMLSDDGGAQTLQTV